MEILANTKLEKLENEGKLHYTSTQHKDADQKINELMNTIRELDAKHKQEISNMNKEFAREKNSIINARHQETIGELETIEEVDEQHVEGLQIENNDLFNKLEEERKKNSLLEETLRSMRKKFKDEIDALNVKNNEQKQN